MTFLRSQDNSSDISLLAGDAERGFLVVGYRLLSATVVVTLHFHRSLRSTVEDMGSGSMVRDVSETSTMSQLGPLLFDSLSIDGSGTGILSRSRYGRSGSSLLRSPGHVAFAVPSRCRGGAITGESRTFCSFNESCPSPPVAHFGLFLRLD